MQVVAAYAKIQFSGIFWVFGYYVRQIMSRLFQQDSFLTLNKRYEEEENQVIEICIDPDSKK